MGDGTRGGVLQSSTESANRDALRAEIAVFVAIEESGSGSGLAIKQIDTGLRDLKSSNVVPICAEPWGHGVIFWVL
ncbi:MAG: hypothetical protein EPN34_00805 [Burkholderiaceae bacterium]|nr:MAG: hypothetical protein EPN34_00805 [Burkholderiaceae bacterium]